MKLRLISIALASLIMTAPTGASANEPKWTGLSVGLGGGGGAVVHDLTLAPGPLLPPGSFDFGFDGIGGEGVFGTVSVGLDYQFHRNWVIGAFFDYDFSDIETTINLSVPPLLGLQAGGKLSLDNMWTIGGRLGYLASPSTLIYGLVGYTEANFSDLTFTASGPIVGSYTATVPNFSGYSVGFGMETLLVPNLSMKAEYRYTELDRESLGTGFETFLDTRLEPSLHTGRLSVNYRFDFDRSTTATVK